MSKIAFFVLAFSFGWYMLGEVYGKQQQSTALELLTDSRASNNDELVVPELTKDRIALLRRIAGISTDNKLSSVDTPMSDTGDPAISLNPVATESLSPKLKNNVPASYPQWESTQAFDKTGGTRKGIAYSGWTTLLPSASESGEKIQTVLVASCNSEGDRSLFVRMLSKYPGSDSQRDVVNVKVGWDSADPYAAPFTYDAGLNALRLQAGLEDTLAMIKGGNKVTIQLPWHKDREAVFEFSLKGSSKALNTAFGFCRLQTS